jgi:ABC-2 type transport system ATP-binding protein
MEVKDGMDALTEPALLIQGLSRTYKIQKGWLKSTVTWREALRDISLHINRGELFGLLGPNGAGKTTLVKILATILLPSSGTARILGYDLVKDTEQVRQMIGVVFGGERGLYPRLTARQTLFYWAALYRVDYEQARKRVPELLDLVGLSSRADEQVEKYSRGMKQRLHLARGLVHYPAILFLDEPTIGLDPVAAISMRDIIKQLQQQGMTIFLTTHYMQEAEVLCNRVAFLKDGQIILLDTPQALSKAAATLEVEVVLAGGDPRLVEQLRRSPHIQACSSEETGNTQTLHIQLVRNDALPLVLALLAEARVASIVTREPSLEDIYLRLLGDRKMLV